MTVQGQLLPLARKRRPAKKRTYRSLSNLIEGSANLLDISRKFRIIINAAMFYLFDVFLLSEENLFLDTHDVDNKFIFCHKLSEFRSCDDYNEREQAGFENGIAPSSFRTFSIRIRPSSNRSQPHAVCPAMACRLSLKGVSSTYKGMVAGCRQCAQKRPHRPRRACRSC